MPSFLQQESQLLSLESQKRKGQAGECKSCILKKKEGSGLPLREAVDIGETGDMFIKSRDSSVIG